MEDEEEWWKQDDWEKSVMEKGINRDNFIQEK